jgi:aminopeptidase N
LGLIANQLKSDHMKINSNNRAQLLDDYLNMARANLVPYAKALDLTLYLSEERDYVWKAAFTALDFIDSMLYNSAGYALWRPYINNLIIPLYNSIGFEERPDDKHLQLYTRNIALDWVCRFGNADCLSKTRAAYAAWMKDPDNDE